MKTCKDNEVKSLYRHLTKNVYSCINNKPSTRFGTNGKGDKQHDTTRS